MQVINNWLQGKRNFLVGLVLYDQYGSDISLKRLFHQKGDTPYNRSRLLDELTSIANGTQKKATHTVIELPVKAFNDVPIQKPTHTADAMLLAIDKEWKPIYQKMKFLQGQLIALGSDNSKETMLKAEDLCEQILSLEKQCMAVWSKRDYYLAHGKLPNYEPVEEEIPTTPIELGRFVENCKRQIRRMRKNMLQNPSKSHYVQLYNDWKAKYRKATGLPYTEKE